MTAEVCEKHLWTHSTYACPWCASEGRCMTEEEATYAMKKNQHKFEWEKKRTETAGEVAK